MLTQNFLLTVLIFLPMAGVASLLVLRSDDHEWIKRLAIITALAEFLFSLNLLRGFDSANGTFQFTEFHDWIPSLGIHYHLGMDGISLFLVLLSTFLTPIAMLASWNSIHERVKAFFIALPALSFATMSPSIAHRWLKPGRAARAQPNRKSKLPVTASMADRRAFAPLRTPTNPTKIDCRGMRVMCARGCFLPPR